MAFAVLEFQHKYVKDSCEVVQTEVEVVASKWIQGNENVLVACKQILFVSNGCKDRSQANVDIEHE